MGLSGSRVRTVARFGASRAPRGEATQDPRGLSHFQLIGLIALCALLGCGPSPTSPVSPVPVSSRAPDPPLGIQQSMSARGAEFVPLSDDALAEVSVAATDAEDAARDAGGRQRPQLTDTGFVYLGRWTPPPQSLGHATMPPPIAAYVVQLIAEPTSGDSEGRSAFAVVDAATGVVIVLFDGCSGSDCAPT